MQWHLTQEFDFLLMFYDVRTTLWPFNEHDNMHLVMDIIYVHLSSANYEESGYDIDWGFGANSY